MSAPAEEELRQIRAELEEHERRAAALHAVARRKEREARARSLDRFTIDTPLEYALARVIFAVETCARAAGASVDVTTPIGAALAEARDAIAAIDLGPGAIVPTAPDDDDAA